MPLDNTLESVSCFFVKEKSQGHSDAWQQSDISESDLFASQVRSLLELGFNNPKGSDVVLFASLISLLGHGRVAKSAVKDPRVVG
jgi:hypothetical protein